MNESETFRSLVAVGIWWLWVLFALGNLIDLAVQGRDHLSVVAAFVLLFLTGVAYVTALRPKVVADDDGLTIVNPVRDHRVGWRAVTGIDTADLLRVRCEWETGAEPGRRVIYAWAVHASRRRQAAAEMRQRRQAHRAARDSRDAFAGPRGRGGYGSGGLGGGGLFGAAQRDYGPPPAAIDIDAGKVVGTLTARVDLARATAPDEPATAPVTGWNWPAIAALLVPALAVLIAALV